MGGAPKRRHAASCKLQQNANEGCNERAKNYCNRTLTVQVIVENVVTCFFLRHSV